MKIPFLFVLAAAALPAQAALEATLQTTRGDIKVTLEYTKAPRTVGNFVSLAEGTRAWIDPRSGAVKKQPFYNGIGFHRVVNDSTFKIIQAGSPMGDGSDGPGFVFPDEFHATLPVEAYVLAMANSGPNTNGSQIFFTGNVGASWLTNVHSVFGTVTDTASRAVIDAILAAGAGAPPASPTTITNVTIARTDAGALAFDPLAQVLPTVTAPVAALTVANPAAGLGTIAVNQPARSLLRLYQSTNLSAWNDLGYLYLDRFDTPLTEIDVGGVVQGVPSQFFRVPVTAYPSDAMAPSEMAGRTLTVQTGYGAFVVVFNNSGGGTLIYGTSSYPLSHVSHDPEGYRADLDIRSNFYPLAFQLAYDSETSTLLSGRAKGYYSNGFSWSDLYATSFTLTK